MTLAEVLAQSGALIEKWRLVRPRPVRITVNASRPEGVDIIVRPRVNNAAEFNALVDLTSKTVPWEAVNSDPSIILTSIDDMLTATLSVLESVISPDTEAEPLMYRHGVLRDEWGKWLGQMLGKYGEEARYSLCVASLEGGTFAHSLDLPELASICRGAWTKREAAKADLHKQILAEMREAGSGVN